MNIEESQDHGFEKISLKLRQESWIECKKHTGQEREVFIELITNKPNNGVSSFAEAERLFLAHQLGESFLFDKKSNIYEVALSFAETLNNGFQNKLRPITDKKNSEEELLDFINYYFPTKESTENFYNILNNPITEAVEESVEELEAQENFDFEEEEEEVEIPEQKIENQAETEEEIIKEEEIFEPVEEPKEKIQEIKVKEEIKFKKYNNKEREKILEYLELEPKERKNFKDLSERVRLIIDRYYNLTL